MRTLIFFRAVLFYLFWALAVISFFFLMVVGLLLPVYWRGRIMVWCVSVVFWGLKHILGIGYHLIGAEHIPKVPHVVLSKHQSAWETIAFNWLFYPACFVLKKELIRIPFFGWGLAMAGSIAIDRRAGIKAMAQVVEMGKRRLADGFNVIIFPEGTRVPPGERRPYRRSGALLACQMGVPIVPVALNTGEFMPRGLAIKKTGKVTISIGPTIDPIGRQPSDVAKAVEDWIEAEMQVISDPAVYAGETASSPSESPPVSAD